jgi:hypothetical protein
LKELILPPSGKNGDVCSSLCIEDCSVGSHGGTMEITVFGEVIPVNWKIITNISEEVVSFFRFKKSWVLWSSQR